MITSFRHDKQRENKRRKLLGVFLVLSLLMFLARVPLANMFGGFLVFIGEPMWKTKSSVLQLLQNTGALFASKIDLQKENTRLHDELSIVALESYSRESLRAENEILKAKLGRNSNHTLLLARVLSSPASSPYDTLVVDVGIEHGVTVGMEVFADGDFVIGEISRVWKETALVSLFSSPDSEVSVSIGTSSIPGIARGTGGGNFRIILPKGLPVSVGDLIEMPALSPHYTGVVSGVARPEGTSLQAIFTALPLNIYELKWVYIAFPMATTSTSALLTTVSKVK